MVTEYWYTGTGCELPTRRIVLTQQDLEYYTPEVASVFRAYPNLNTVTLEFNDSSGSYSRVVRPE